MIKELEDILIKNRKDPLPARLNIPITTDPEFDEEEEFDAVESDVEREQGFDTEETEEEF